MKKNKVQMPKITPHKGQGYLDEATEALFADFMAGMLVVNGEKGYISLPETIGNSKRCAV